MTTLHCFLDRKITASKHLCKQSFFGVYTSINGISSITIFYIDKMTTLNYQFKGRAHRIIKKLLKNV